MARPITAPTRGDGGAALIAAVSELRTILPFDAMQLLRHDPRRTEVSEVFRSGYAADAAWALQHLFTEKYRVGFTGTLSPNDGLPPAISSVRSEFREDFVGSTIYRDYLRVNGYRDGMSMELFLGDRYVGIAHFSAKASVGFSAEARRAASGVGGLLAALILGERADETNAIRGSALGADAATHGRGTTWYVFSAPRGTHPLGPGTLLSPLEDARFLSHLAQFRQGGWPVARHLWQHEGRLFRLELRRSGIGGEVAVGIAEADAEDHFRLSAQELRVLSLLCAGHDDAAIAMRMQLSRRTVESHVLNVRRKLDARNRVEAVVRAITTATILPDPVACPIGTIVGSAGPRLRDAAEQLA
jgi:DNA-binding CsgD family transcriptional regulator